MERKFPASPTTLPVEQEAALYLCILVGFWSQPHIGLGIAALQAYRSAEIGLERAKGTILDFHHIVVDDARKIEN